MWIDFFVPSPDGAELPPVEIPPISTVSELAASGRTAVWAVESFTRPAQWWACRDGEAPDRTALGTTGAVELSGYRVTREFATSADGTRVPMTVLATPDAPRGGSRTSRTASTTSSPAPTTWSPPASPAGSGWRSWAAPTAGC